MTSQGINLHYGTISKNYSCLEQFIDLFINVFFIVSILYILIADSKCVQKLKWCQERFKCVKYVFGAFIYSRSKLLHRIESFFFFFILSSYGQYKEFMDNSKFPRSIKVKLNAIA